MLIYNRKFITKIRKYLNEVYSDAVFSTEVQNKMVKYQYKFSFKKIIPYQKVKAPYYILILKIIFISVNDTNEEFKLYQSEDYLTKSKFIRRNYFKDIIKNSVVREINAMFGEGVLVEILFSNEKILDLLKK